MWETDGTIWMATSTTASTTFCTYTCSTAASDDYYPLFSLERERERQGEILKNHSEDARLRARELLLRHLTYEQRKTFEKNGWFVVIGEKTGNKYKIAENDNLAANIYALEGDRVSHRLCGHCDLEKVPLADHLLAQKMMLESAEDDFLKIANRHAA